MGESECPNCGHPLADYRTDRQSAGERQVVLHWSMCQRCRHVALKRWEFLPESMPVGCTQEQ